MRPCLAGGNETTDVRKRATGCAPNRPASFSEHAPASCRQLQNVIAATYGVQTYHVHMAKDLMNRDRARAWAFLEVTDETDGAYLIHDIGGARFNGAPLCIEWVTTACQA